MTGGMKEQPEKRVAGNGSDWTEILDPELTEEMVEADGEKLLVLLKNHSVLPPEENRINAAITELDRYMDCLYAPIQRNLSPHAKAKPLDLFLLAWQYMGKWHLLAASSLYLLAFLFISFGADKTNPYAMVAGMAPLPFLLGAADLFRSLHSGMLELEISFKTSSWKFLLSKLVILCMSNVILNTMFSIAFTGMHTGISLWKLTIYWCLPFFAVCSLSLLLAVLIREVHAQTVVLGIWTAVAVLLFSEQRFQLWLANLDFTICLVAAAAAILVFAGDIYYLLIRMGRRGGLFEAFN